MSDVFDRELELYIFHYLHKNLSNIDELTDNDIKMAIIQLLETLIPEIKIDYIDSANLKIQVKNQIMTLNLKQWIDKIKILYHSYNDYLEKQNKI